MADLTITRTRTSVFDIAVTSGIPPVPVDLTGKTIKFTAKERLSSNATLIAKQTGSGITTQAPPTAGLAVMQIDPNDTASLDDIQINTAVWDLELIDGTNVYQLSAGSLAILGNVG